MYIHVVEKYRSCAFNLDQFGVSGFLHVKEIHVKILYKPLQYSVERKQTIGYMYYVLHVNVYSNQFFGQSLFDSGYKQTASLQCD